MKRVSSLLTGVFLLGIVYAQEKKDTIPAVSNQPITGVQDTVPVWAKDSLMRKKWDDSVWRVKHFDSLKRGAKTWNEKDSLNPGAKTWKEKDSLNPSAAKQGWQDTTATTTDKSKWKEKKENSMSKNDSDTTAPAKTKKIVSDRVMMKDGEMVIIKKGKEMKMVKSIKLPDGNIVMTDGTVKMPDGNSVKLKDGEYINIKAKPANGK
jgi:hypothetical protein